MEKRKYRSPLGGDKNSDNRWIGPKGQAALALAVSLWIAGGVVVSAQEITVDENYNGYIYGNTVDPNNKSKWWVPNESNPNNNMVTVNNGVTVTGSISGSLVNENYDVTNNTVTVNGTVTFHVYGGQSYYKNANNNIAIINGTVQENVCGGYTMLGIASGNSVTINGTVNKDVYGGYSYSSATGNRVTVSGIVNGNVYGGGYNPQSSATGAMTGNQITLNGAKVTGNVYGGYNSSGELVTDNTLDLSSANTAGGTVGNFATINIKEVKWGTPVLTAKQFNNVNRINVDNLVLTNPSAAGGSTNLLTSINGGLDTPTVTGTLQPQAYTNSPIVAGVMADGTLNGKIDKSANAITYTTTSNVISKLTFTNVAWKDSGALINNSAGGYTFTNADVDTTNINFTNIKSLAANKTMTLVSNFGNSISTITGTKYKVGSTLEGEGEASLVGEDLIFTAKTGVEGLTAQEQTHNTVMGATASMAALSAGNDFVGAATEGLSMAGNTGTDGMATYANMGGGSMNVETGSHVKTHTWNAILALGHKNEKKLSTTEYGAFFEYGTGNYTTFNGAERGDGSTRYTGGGILGKWQKNNGFYVEGSLRAGSIHDDATNVLRDVNGNPYSYDTDATYWGAHIGVGREIKLNKTDILDLYAKYFYNHRGSVSFDAGGHYDLDAVESSVLRLGTRYTVKQNDNINYYGGLAVEHEFCGRASGFADGVAIRGADISGTSVRGEIGAKFKPDEKSNVTLDLNLSGFAGKKEGLTGGLSAVFHI